MAGEFEDLENTLGYEPTPGRRRGRSRVLQRKGTCKNGHSLEGDNLITRAGGKRACRTCKNIRQREWKAKNLERIAEYNAKYNAKHRTTSIKLRFTWDGEKGRVAASDTAVLLHTDWVVAADFLKDVASIVKEHYIKVLELKHTGRGEDHGG